MLRGLVLALLLANLGWAAWTRGWLPEGWLPPPGDAAQREPQRLARQVRPDAITVRPAGDAPPPAPVAPPAAYACLQAGPLGATDWPVALAAVQAAGLDATQWTRVPAGGGTDADPAGGSAWLRVPSADEATAQRLQALADRGLAFAPCP